MVIGATYNKAWKSNKFKLSGLAENRWGTIISTHHDKICLTIYSILFIISKNHHTNVWFLCIYQFFLYQITKSIDFVYLVFPQVLTECFHCSGTGAGRSFSICTNVVTEKFASCSPSAVFLKIAWSMSKLEFPQRTTLFFTQISSVRYKGATYVVFTWQINVLDVFAWSTSLK